MRTLTSILLFIFIGQTALCQHVKVDSVGSRDDNQFAILSREFQGLKENVILNDLEVKLKMKLTTISICLSILEYSRLLPLDSLEISAIKDRLKEFSEALVNEGTPVLIYGTGMSSFDNARAKNTFPNKYNLTYVSMGNSCLGTYGSLQDYGISAFNRRTLDRLGLKYIPGTEPINNKSKKKKKKNGA